MNLFWLSVLSEMNAQLHCDTHVIVSSREAVQVLWTIWQNLCGPPPESAPESDGGRVGYKPTQQKHPITIWVGRSRANYMLTCAYALSLFAEYTYRTGKVHSSEKHAKWLTSNCPPIFPENGITPIPLVVGNRYIEYAETMLDAVDAYRHYYVTEKAKTLGSKNRFTYTKRDRPDMTDWACIR